MIFTETRTRVSLGATILGGLLACMTGASTAHAQALKDAGAKERARALLKEGRVLVKRGDYRGGCPKFEESIRIFPAATTMINLALCHVHEGKLATAIRDYQRAINLCAEIEELENRRELEKRARESLKELELRVPRLRVLIASYPGLRLSLDEEDITAAPRGDALLVDPGAHKIEAHAPGFVATKLPFTLVEGENKDLTIKLVPPPARRDWRRTGGWVMGSVGLAGLGLGATTLAGAWAFNGELQSICPEPRHCTTGEGKSVADTTRTLSNVSRVSFAAGIAGLASGVLLLFLSSPPTGDRARQAQREVTLQWTGAGVEGSFW